MSELRLLVPGRARHRTPQPRRPQPAKLGFQHETVLQRRRLVLESKSRENRPARDACAQSPS